MKPANSASTQGLALSKLDGLLVIGAGGHGRVVADLALSSGVWSEIAFADDGVEESSEVLGLQVVGVTAKLCDLRSRFRAAVVAIGDAATRLRLLRYCKELGYELPVLVHESSSVSRFATLSRGCVVFAQAAVNTGAILGEGCIVNTGATVDHDCELGPGVHVCPGASLAGRVKVGASSWIGVGACVRDGIEIGGNVMIGAGAVVVRDVEPGLTVMGSPARPWKGR